MGLDMYLNAKKYLWQDDKEAEAINEALMDAKGMKAKVIVVEAAYWRKANHIHNWFVENVQEGVDNCSSYYVSRPNLEVLLNTCKDVLSNKEKAADLLPSSGGFFFGSTDYDKWYFDETERTVALIQKTLELPDDWDFEYQSSW